jgi:hypothetical protein
MCYRPAGVRAPNVIIKRKATPSELAQALGTSFTPDESPVAIETTDPSKTDVEVQAKALHIH